jgi:hypothetical protein
MLRKVTTTNCMQTLHSSSKIGRRLRRGGTSGETASAGDWPARGCIHTDICY